MTIKLVDPEAEVDIVAPSRQYDGVAFEADSYGARLSKQETPPDPASQEYRFLYLPTMLAVYTARHQRMPASDEWLREHVFGSNDHTGCEACREETEFLVAHQKKFF